MTTFANPKRMTIREATAIADLPFEHTPAQLRRARDMLRAGGYHRLAARCADTLAYLAGIRNEPKQYQRR